MAQTPFNVLTKVAQGFVASSCVYAVAQAGIADALDDTPRTAQDLAAATGTHAGALKRILRVLCAEEVFETRPGGYVSYACVVPFFGRITRNPCGGMYCQ
jgi:hypothetical protein